MVVNDDSENSKNNQNAWVTIFTTCKDGKNPKNPAANITDDRQREIVRWGVPLLRTQNSEKFIRPLVKIPQGLYNKKCICDESTIYFILLSVYVIENINT